MTKQKKSFFEKLTGIQRIDDENEIEINDTSSPRSTKKIVEEDSYEFPEEESLKASKSNDDFFQGSVEKEEAIDDDFGSEYDESKESPLNQEKSSIIGENKTEEMEADAEGQLTIDVYQTDRDIVIKSTIAGVKPEDLDIDINSEMVTIKGKRSQEEEIDSENYYYQECYWGPFSRSIVLPVEIITEKAEATMKNGILTVRLPKMEAVKTRKLQVRGF